METTNRLTWASVTDRYMYRKSLSSRFVTDLMESQTGTQTDRHKEQNRILLLNCFCFNIYWKMYNDLSAIQYCKFDWCVLQIICVVDYNDRFWLRWIETRE